MHVNFFIHYVLFDKLHPCRAFVHISISFITTYIYIYIYIYLKVLLEPRDKMQ